MNWRYAAATAALMVGGLTGSAQASLIAVDSSFGAGTATRDTQSGLEWLDLSLTQGRPASAVAADAGLAGWHYATETQVLQLLAHAGVTFHEWYHADYQQTGLDRGDGNFAGLDLLASLIGPTGGSHAENPSQHYVWFGGFTGETAATGSHHLTWVVQSWAEPGAHSDPTLPLIYSVVEHLSSLDPPDMSNADAGHWLVRSSGFPPDPGDPSPVPEPSSLVLLGSGLLGAVARLRRRRS